MGRSDTAACACGDGDGGGATGVSGGFKMSAIVLSLAGAYVSPARRQFKANLNESSSKPCHAMLYHVAAAYAMLPMHPQPATRRAVSLPQRYAERIRHQAWTMGRAVVVPPGCSHPALPAHLAHRLSPREPAAATAC
eukprot:366239-Chlamydomonas_euryale.AAC.29